MPPVERNLKRLASLILLPLAVLAAGDPSAADDDAALEAELDALFREIGDGPIPMLEPRRVPDLVIASTRQVLGELAPCG